jgi:hypothetical protein
VTRVALVVMLCALGSRGAWSQRPGAAAKAPKGAAKTTANPRLNIGVRADTGAPPTVIMREAFEYVRNGRRDPFVSLLTTNLLRPTLSDLKLTGILYDMTGRHSVATLRDAGAGKTYRVTTGDVLGRMRVSAIRPKVVLFTIEEFGTNRQDSLILADTTRARAR